MNNKIYTLKQIIEISTPIFKKYKVKTVFLFGSYAKNIADENSDIDFIMTPPKGFTLFDLSSLENELNEAFEKNIDLISENSYTRDMYNEVSEDGIKAKEYFYNEITNERKLIYD